MGIHVTSYIEPPGKTNKPIHLNHYIYLSSHKKPRRNSGDSLLSLISGRYGGVEAEEEDEEEESDNMSTEQDDYYNDTGDAETLVRFPFASRRLTRRARNITPEYIQRSRLNKNKKRFITYGCRFCRTHLSSSLQIISKDYRGKTGDAYLISTVCNVLEDKIETRSMLTGDYLVCDIVCSLCHKTLGWKYLKSERKEQRYKEGKYILEVETICRCD
ncbi:hypothetical protein MOUN0_H07030 [Monosporozyma unispora]|nr:hypothetical protein C6P44_000443 [Kazachstania unispora]